MTRFEHSEHIDAFDLKRELRSITMNGKKFYTVKGIYNSKQLVKWLNDAVPESINTIDGFMDWLNNYRSARIVFNTYTR